MIFMTLPKGYVPPNKIADEKAKQLADEKTLLKENDAKLIHTENSYNKSGSPNGIDYALLWDEMKKAYMQTAKEATISYFRLLNIWMKDFKK